MRLLDYCAPPMLAQGYEDGVKNVCMFDSLHALRCLVRLSIE